MKGLRLLKMKQLISEHDIETQEEMVEHLHKAGFNVAQATVSRDIKELHLIKVPTTNGRYKYALPAQHNAHPLRKLRRTLTDNFVNIDAANNLVVMHCLPGTANAIGSLIDNMAWAELLGTICGDDTILLISRSEQAGQHVIQRIYDVMASRENE